MQLSQAFENKAKKMGVPIQYIIIADLMSLGYAEGDAYTIAYPENAALSPRQNKGIKENILSSEKFREILGERIETHEAIDTNTPVEDGELMGKRQTAKLIMTAAMKQPADSKERIEGLMKYSDLMGYKKDEAETDATETIEFFLPLKCDQCPLLRSYNEYRKEHKKRELKPVEMGHVMLRADMTIGQSGID